VLFAGATPADVLWPTRQVEQARVVAEGEATLGLSPAGVGQADQSEAVGTSPAAEEVIPLWRRPESRPVIQVGEFVQHGG
jgi:hypothetical protein